MKKLRVTLEIDVVELPQEQQEDAINQSGLTADELGFSPGDYDPWELAETLENQFYPESISEMLAGTNIYVTFQQGAIIKSAEWVA